MQDDAISRDAVKELIKSGVSTDTYDDVEQVCKWIDALPSVTQKSDNKYRKETKRWKNKWLKAQKSGKWIPVSERLPEDNGYYLTTTMYHAVYCDYWEEDRFNRTEAVIAWMPLPKPYEPQESEG